MSWTVFVMGATLLGQVSQVTPPPTLTELSPTAVQPTYEVEPPTELPIVPLADLPSSSAALSPQTTPQMVAEALVLPPESQLTGQPLSLLSALSSTTNQQTRLQVVHTYWQLAETVAIYGYILEYDRWIRDLSMTTEEVPALQAARASSSALVQEAQVAAVAMQHELASLVLSPTNSPLPLPADQPHVGPYNTHFDRLFATRTPPERTKLIDRTLPLRAEAIERRAAAVQAACEALAAAEANTTPLYDRLATAEECLRQRQALFESVCRYNEEIADYALAVSNPGSTPQALVAMLIHTDAQPLRPTPMDTRESVEPAGYRQAVPPATWNPGQRTPTPVASQPQPDEAIEENPVSIGSWTPSSTTVAPEAVPPATSAEPTPPETTSPELISPEATPPQPLLPVPVEPVPLQPVPPDPVSPEPASAEPMPTAPIPVVPTPVTVHKPTAEDWNDLCPPALYPALRDISPTTRTEQLALALHWDQIQPDQSGPPLSLEACLAASSPNGRQESIAAYWLARQRAAEYQVLAEQVQWFDQLLLVPLDAAAPSASRLRAASMEARASLIEAHTALLAAQYELAVRLSRQADAQWPMPSTVPRAQAYSLPQTDSSPTPANSWAVQRLQKMIPGLAETLQRRASALVEADIARTDAAVQADDPSIARLLECIHNQTRQTLAFLTTLTDYNRAIAEYAVATLPPETSAEALTESLVTP